MKHLGKLGAAVALALLANGAYAKDSALEIGLTASADKAHAGSAIMRYSLTNNGKVDLLVQAIDTPLRGVYEDLFDVRANGREVLYTGRHVKRAMPQPEDYVEIKAGQTLSVDIDLSSIYDMSAAGDYEVQALGHFHESFQVKAVNGDEKLAPISERDLRSPVVSLWVEGSPVPFSQAGFGVESFTKAVSFVGCNNSQQSSINSGTNAAKSMAADANAYLAANKQGTRYTTWFGAYSSSNYSTLKSHFTAIGDAVNNKPLVFDCSTCTINAYAYVYPTQPYKIYLCGAYWSAPISGTDSKGGTTIHEISHFNAVAGTDDHAYGQAACKKLVKRPKTALDNADSHEYFAENTPALN